MKFLMQVRGIFYQKTCEFLIHAAAMTHWLSLEVNAVDYPSKTQMKPMQALKAQAWRR